MKNSNLLQRTLTCVVGIPALAALIFLLPQHNYIGFSIFTMLLAVTGSVEMSRLLFGRTVWQTWVVWLTVPLLYLLLLFSPDKTPYRGEAVFSICFGLALIIVLGSEIFTGEADNFKGSAERASKKVLLLLYPSFLLTFLIRILAVPGISSMAVLLFFILVFSNDIFAYVFGMLFGRNNAGVFKVSPKKSIAGFAGGFAACVGICFLYTRLAAQQLPPLSVAQRTALGAGISVFANIGDMTESVFKRSAGVKDSGKAVPGRGGVLDCIDSVMACAPVFYLVFCPLFAA